jgi:hypothetical protein
MAGGWYSFEEAVQEGVRRGDLGTEADAVEAVRSAFGHRPPTGCGSAADLDVDIAEAFGRIGAADAAEERAKLRGLGAAAVVAEGAAAVSAASRQRVEIREVATWTPLQTSGR